MLAKYIKIVCLFVSDIQSEAKGDDERLTSRRRKQRLPSRRADELANRSDCKRTLQCAAKKKRFDLHFVVTIYLHFSLKWK